MTPNSARILQLLRSYTDKKGNPEEQKELMTWLAEQEDDGSFQKHI